MAVLFVILVVLIWSTSGVIAEQRPTGVSGAHLVLDIRNNAVTTPAIVTAAIKDASNIWAPYGVRLERSKRVRESRAGNAAPTVSVTLDSAHVRRRASTAQTPVGVTGFSSDGTPIPVISIFYDAIALAASGGVVFGLRDVQSSSMLRDRLVARMLGRTIAHELGHVILRTPAHSPSGLMRAIQTVAELAHPTSAGFTLEPRDVARLQQVLGPAGAVAAAAR